VEALRDIPIIVMTARSQPEVLRAAFDAGATDYIKKPFEGVELVARVKAALKLKKEIDARKHWEHELTKTIGDLDAALREMVALQQLIPVCPVCKNSPTDPASQSALKSYIQAHPGAKFHYAVCSSCSTSKN
jgi:sigma-B regulation protein RsbU (phosphoserine phosphatase)